MSSGVTRPLLKLAKHLNVGVQRSAAVAIAGLALGILLFLRALSLACPDSPNIKIPSYVFVLFRRHEPVPDEKRPRRDGRSAPAH
jgi:hypothetical protein